MAALGCLVRMAESRAAPRTVHSAVPSPLKNVSQNVSIAVMTDSASPSTEVLITWRRRERSRSSLKSEADWIVFFVCELSARAVATRDTSGEQREARRISEAISHLSLGDTRP